MEKDKGFNIKYIGYIGVKTSMRSLEVKTRSEVAKESINRLCEEKKIWGTQEQKRFDAVNYMLDEVPNLLYSGTKVRLDVTTTHLNVVALDTESIIIQHEMQNVSFATNGDKATAIYVAYVAKDLKFGRACFVLDCGSDQTAIEELEKIRRGFESRTQQIFYNTTLGGNISTKTLTSNDKFSTFSKTVHLTNSRDTILDSSQCTGNDENQSNEDTIEMTRASLQKEPWFHGSYLSREMSETRLKQDGDFLVRESMLDQGHFVLSVMHDGVKLHLLFDSMNQVRTKDMIFDDISHLVKYYQTERSPIVADKRNVYLLNGVARPNK